MVGLAHIATHMATHILLRGTCYVPTNISASHAPTDPFPALCATTLSAIVAAGITSPISTVRHRLPPLPRACARAAERRSNAAANAASSAISWRSLMLLVHALLGDTCAEADRRTLRRVIIVAALRFRWSGWRRFGRRPLLQLEHQGAQLGFCGPIALARLP